MYNLLIVDDEEIILQGLSQFIDWNNLGFHLVDTATTITQALTIIEEQSVDVLLTDLHLEDESGLDLIAHLHSVEPQIKTIILSGYGEFQYAQQALRLEVFDFLTKPVEFNLLYQTFQKLFALLEKEKQLPPVPLPPKEEESFLGEIDQMISELESNDIIEKIKTYIGENYMENITLQSLSEEFFLHPIYLSKLFKNKTGENFIDYLTMVRFRVAKRLLEQSNLKVYEICDLCGYKSAKYFSKIFKSLSGFTPKEYRSSLGIEERPSP